MEYTKGKWEIDEYEAPNEYNQPDLSEIQIKAGRIEIAVLWPIMKPNTHSFGHPKDEEDEKETLANAARIVECVNAFDGIEDPIAFIKIMNENNKALVEAVEQRDALLGACKATSTWITLKTASHCTCGKTDVTRSNIRKGLDDAIAEAEK